jgi:hypothetical protein
VLIRDDAGRMFGADVARLSAEDQLYVLEACCGRPLQQVGAAGGQLLARMMATAVSSILVLNQPTQQAGAPPPGLADTLLEGWRNRYQRAYPMSTIPPDELADVVVAAEELADLSVSVAGSASGKQRRVVLDDFFTKLASHARRQNTALRGRTQPPLDEIDRKIINDTSTYLQRNSETADALKLLSWQEEGMQMPPPPERLPEDVEQALSLLETRSFVLQVTLEELVQRVERLEGFHKPSSSCGCVKCRGLLFRR